MRFDAIPPHIVLIDTATAVVINRSTVIGFWLISDAGNPRRVRPPCFREPSTAHVSCGDAEHIVRVEDLPVEVDLIRMVTESVSGDVTCTEHRCRVIADPSVLDPEPPVALEELICYPELVLRAVFDVDGRECAPRVDGAINLDPSFNVLVPTLEVITILFVANGCKEGEQMR